MNPSERIRVALSRSDTTRPSTTTVPSVDPKPEVEEALRMLADVDEQRAASSPATSVVAQTTPTHHPTPKPEVAAPNIARTDPAIRRSRRHYVVIGVLALLALGGVLTREYWLPLTKPKPAAPTLQMEVRSEGNGLLNVLWNPDSAVVTQAREGRLSILEANQTPRVVTLQPEQLHSGHLYYQSTAERLEFQLEVVSMTGATVKETVLALSSGKPSPDGPQMASVAPTAQQLAQPQQNAQPAATHANAQAPTPAPAATKPDRTQPQVEAMNRTPQQPDAPAARTFTPPPVTRRVTTEEAHSVVLDPSSTPTAGVVPARLDLPQGLGNIPVPPPVKPPAAQAPSAVQSQSVSHRVGGAVQPAVLLRKVAPQYPSFAKASHVEGVVKFTATVDKDGSVKNVQIVSGPPLLVKSAEEAVRQWVYRPMMLDGKPTDVVTQIEVRFALRQ